nr:hypothetical protein [uncultured Flavobacterium sp.]
MKKITLLFLLFTAFSYSQDKPNGTTLEEYNYMTKGYQIQISSGLDEKKGYHVSDIETLTIGAYVFEFKNLIRIATGDSAGIILISKSTLWGNVYYNCIPIDNSSLFTQFNTRLEDWDEPMVTAYSLASTYLFSNYYNFYNQNKINAMIKKK